jgi:Replication initiator protein A
MSAKQATTHTPLPALKDIEARDEMNFAEFPIALLSDRVPSGMSMLEFHDTIRDQNTGQDVIRRVTIDAPERFGLPTALDDEVILGLIQLTKVRNNFTERTVHFSRYELIHLLGWADNGVSYRRLEESLDRWVRITLDYQRAWWDNRQKGWVDEKFHILERVSLFDSARDCGKPTLPFSLFTWNEVVFESFRAGYMKRLDLAFYLNLHHATARRVYRFLDKRFYHRSRWDFDLATFAFEHVGLSRSSCMTKAKGGKGYVSLSKVKEKLTPGIEELETLGYLEPMSAEERYPRVSRGEWRVAFVKKATAIQCDKPTLKDELVARGITAKIADNLVAAHPAEQIARQLDVFDWRKEQSEGEGLRNPGAWLVAAIEDDYAPPPAYEPKSVRDAKKAAVKEAAQRVAATREKRQEIERQKQATEEAIRKATRDHVDRYLAGLAAHERLALEQRAIMIEPMSREFLRKDGPLADAARSLAIEKEVLRVCPMQ